MEQQSWRNGRMNRPQHGNHERRNDLSTGNQLPNADANGKNQKEGQQAVEPQVTGCRILQFALAYSENNIRDVSLTLTVSLRQMTLLKLGTEF